MRRRRTQNRAALEIVTDSAHLESNSASSRGAEGYGNARRGCTGGRFHIVFHATRCDRLFRQSLILPDLKNA